MRTQIGQPVQFLWGFGIASRAYRVSSQGDFDSCNSEFPKLSRFPASSAFTRALTSSLTSALTRHGQVAGGLGICRSQFGDLCLPPGLWFGDHHSGPRGSYLRHDRGDKLCADGEYKLNRPLSDLHGLNRMLFQLLHICWSANSPGCGCLCCSSNSELQSCEPLCLSDQEWDASERSMIFPGWFACLLAL